MDRDFRIFLLGLGGGKQCGTALRRQQAERLLAESDGGDFLDTRQRDQDQRNQQDATKGEGEGRTPHEIVGLLIGEDVCGPGTDGIRRNGEHDRLHRRRRNDLQDRQRQQNAHQQREAGILPVIRIHDRSGPGEFRLTIGVEHAPIGTDAAFEELPRLIDGFDDVVVHADRLGAGDEVSDHDGLFEGAGLGAAQIIALARPAEFGDHDSLAGEGFAQEAVDIDGLIDGLGVLEVFPVGQDMRSDEIDRGRELRVVAPDIPDFAGSDGHADLPLHLANIFDQVVDLEFVAIECFVADDDADDVRVLLREIHRRDDFSLIAIGILVDPDTERDLEAELGCDGRHDLDAAGGRVETDRPRHGRELLEVGTDLVDGRDIVDVRMRRAFERRVGHAGNHALEIGRILLLAEQRPQAGMNGGHKENNGDDSAHRVQTITGRSGAGLRTCPRGPASGDGQTRSATEINNSTAAMAFSGQQVVQRWMRTAVRAVRESHDCYFGASAGLASGFASG